MAELVTDKKKFLLSLSTTTKLESLTANGTNFIQNYL
jgi:hypothetical protein